MESLKAIDGTNVYDLLAAVRTPTLALHGTLDKIVPYSHAEKLVAAIPGARLVTFEGAGHMLHGRHAVKVNHLIRDFVLDRPVESHRDPGATERRRRPRRARRRTAPSAASCGSRARSASATSSGTSPSPASSARSTRTPPWTSSPPTPPTAWWRPGASACIRPPGSS